MKNVEFEKPEFEIHINPLDIAKTLGSWAMDNVTKLMGNLPTEPVARHSEHFEHRPPEITFDEVLDREGEAQPSPKELADEMMAKPEAQEAFEQLQIEYDSLPDLKNDGSWDVT